MYCEFIVMYMILKGCTWLFCYTLLQAVVSGNKLMCSASHLHKGTHTTIKHRRKWCRIALLFLELKIFCKIYFFSSVRDAYFRVDVMKSRAVELLSTIIGRFLILLYNSYYLSSNSKLFMRVELK